MKVETSHHIDASEPDAQGMHEWHYEYDLFLFTDDNLRLAARSYSDTRQEAHFIGLEKKHKQLNIADELGQPLVLFAIAYLRSVGKTELNYLSADGYKSLPR
ncbi:hypothetical protein D3C72_68980 [compost metagenome]